jgi:hypothetical protein
MGQEAFLRPIENITSGTYINAGGGAITVSVGVYASLLTLLGAIEAASATIVTAELNSDFKVVITLDGSKTLGLSSSEYWKLGFETVSYGAATTHTAEHISPFMWLPTFTSNRIDGWHQKKNYFQGGSAVNGARSGFDLGPIIYETSFDFAYEPVANVYSEATTDGTPTVLGLLSLDQVGTFEHFIRQSKVIQTSSVDSDNISAKGFYYYLDLTGATNLTTMDSGGINYEFAAGADTYTFGHYDAEQIIKPNNSFGRSRERYHVTIPMHTSTAPSWLVDGT